MTRIFYQTCSEYRRTEWENETGERNCTTY